MNTNIWRAGNGEYYSTEKLAREANETLQLSGLTCVPLDNMPSSKIIIPIAIGREKHSREIVMSAEPMSKAMENGENFARFLYNNTTAHFWKGMANYIRAQR